MMRKGSGEEEGDDLDFLQGILLGFQFDELYDLYFITVLFYFVSLLQVFYSYY